MKNLQKIWVRILISFIGGAMIDETIHAITGDSKIYPGRLWIFAIMIYLVLTAIIWLYNWNKSKDIR